jgi:hypothetical protein
MNEPTPDPTPTQPLPGNQPPAEPPPLDPPLPERPDFRNLFESLLRRPAALIGRLGEPGHQAIGKLVLLAVISAIVFGAVLGTFAMHEQLWAAPLKITAGLAIATLICFPSLYIFSSLAGARIAAGHLAACLSGTTALAGLLLLGFAPAVWIFTQSTDSLGFMGFLALATWGISLGFGLGFLHRALKASHATRGGPFAIWAVIFALVTLQMSTSLRPILGRSEQLFTTEKRFFLQHWTETAGEFLEAPEEPTKTAAAEQDPPESQDPADGHTNPYLNQR